MLRKNRGEAAAAPCRGFLDAALTSGRMHGPGADERDEPGDGDPLQAAPGLCRDLRERGGDKPVCAGVSVRGGVAENRRGQVFLHAGVQTLNPLQSAPGDAFSWS